MKIFIILTTLIAVASLIGLLYTKYSKNQNAIFEKEKKKRLLNHLHRMRRLDESDRERKNLI